MNREPKQVLTELLVLQAQAGDETAFRLLHELWRGDLRRLALARVEQPVAAEEVGAEVWLDIARGLTRLDEPGRFPAWACRTVWCRGADWVRCRQRERRRESAARQEAERLARRGRPPGRMTESCACARPSAGCRRSSGSCSLCFMNSAAMSPRSRRSKALRAAPLSRGYFPSMKP